LLVVLVVSLLAMLLIEHFNGLDIEPLREGADKTDRADHIQLLLRLFFLPLIPIGAYVAYLGYQIVRSGRFPPPHSRTLKDLPAQTGRLAIARGWLALLLGICLCGLASYGAFVVPGEIARLVNVQ
jgi:hypothetical protein